MRALARPVYRRDGKVPRHAFVPAEVQPFAYLNSPLPIGHGKTISQPFIVALMTDLLDVRERQRGARNRHRLRLSGGGPGASLRVRSTASRSSRRSRCRRKKRLASLGYVNIALRVGNGALGWPEHAPYDRIMVTAAPDLIPAGAAAPAQAGRRDGDSDRNSRSAAVASGREKHEGRISTREILAVRFSELEEPAGTGRARLSVTMRRSRFSAGAVVLRTVGRAAGATCCCGCFAPGIFPKAAWKPARAAAAGRDARSRRRDRAHRASSFAGVRRTGRPHLTAAARSHATTWRRSPDGAAVSLPINPELGRPEHHEFRWVAYAEAQRLLPERLQPVLRVGARAGRAPANSAALDAKP